MKKLEYEIYGGIGDNLIIRIFFDSIKDNYDQIRISHNKNVINVWRNGDPKYINFLNELGKLLFSEHPYIYDNGTYPHINASKEIFTLKLMPQKPNLDNLLCKGESLNLDEEYIVLTTKIRLISRNVFYPLSPQLWNTLRNVSKKYKIVILGEKDVEKSKEYLHDNNIEMVYGIYEQIIANIPNDRIIDLTVPALGITCPDLKKIQQDCLIMKESKATLTFGIGGNLWLALMVANTIGFRCEPQTASKDLRDWYAITDLVNNPQFTTAFLTKDWKSFLEKLESL